MSDHSTETSTVQVILQDALTGGGWAGAKIGTEDRMNTANTVIDKWLLIFPIPPATIVSKSGEESQEN